MTEYSFLAQLAVKGALMMACIGAAIGGSDSSKAVAVTTLCVLGAIAGGVGLGVGGTAGGVLSAVSDLLSLIATIR
jgi:hypothetical protein